MAKFRKCDITKFRGCVVIAVGGYFAGLLRKVPVFDSRLGAFAALN